MNYKNRSTVILVMKLVGRSYNFKKSIPLPEDHVYRRVRASSAYSAKSSKFLFHIHVYTTG